MGAHSNKSQPPDPQSSQDKVKPTVKVWKKTGTHCARGPRGCQRCVEAAKVTEYVLVKAIYTEHTAEITGFGKSNGKPFYSPFQVLRTFENEEEARRYAEEHHHDCDM
jgi:hypothetical protein